MTKAPPEIGRSRTTRPISNKVQCVKHHQRTLSPLPFFSFKVLPIYILATCVIFFALLHIQYSFQSPPSASPSPSWSLTYQWQRIINTTAVSSSTDCTDDLKSMSDKLRYSVTFLPLKDLRYTQTAIQGHTWFMSSMYDTHEEGEVQYQQFPSAASRGMLLCLKGRDKHDGSWNSYALAWPETLPFNATLMKDLTFVSYNHYNYDNIWHGLSAMVPFVAWHKKNGCETPARWVLYHWGELRLKMGQWLTTLMEATYDGPPYVEVFEGIGDDKPVCFEKAVVMRHNEGGMSRDRRMEAYDLMRCKARVYCNASLKGRGAEVNDQGVPVIGMTMFMRTGPRSFRNETAVIRIFERECAKVDGCRLIVGYSNNLSFCEQVKLMSLTDILVSPHGAQLTNMFLMDRNSSVMEFFPKGWLKLAGVGQYVFHWIASWSGMRHEGAWRDPDGEKCPYPEDDRRCMNIFKSGKIGYNETYFSVWARNVLNEVKARKLEEASKNSNASSTSSSCSCG
ncbi:hypothetical protein CJ030_MR7G008265 [Morella rubra]|uniref:Glycosyltransferase 61 catalytic domain-containing protein n=1 Tax=Morella rubra TaxID=262757 RepID=A0A6A1V292_9ROSI|nr:hypothetical protein CJ030_MR7G008265 [Morella rubra]